MSVPASSLATVVDSYGLPKPALDALVCVTAAMWSGTSQWAICACRRAINGAAGPFSIAQSCFPAPLSCQSPYPYSLVAVVTTPSPGILFPFVDQRQG